MKRKIIALCLVITMLGVAIISGTMAYFTDTAEAVNVMTIGKVDIKLIEEKRPNDQVTTVDPENMDTLDPNTGYHVVPAVYLDGITWQDNTVDPNLKIFNVNMKNVFDKFVSVKNTGRSDAYVRLFFAFEDTDDGLADQLHISFTNDAYFAPVKDATGGVLHTTINGEIYEIYSYTYADPIKPGEQSEYSLKQFFFDKTTTNEHVAAAGDEYTILVLAQAIQADGWETATAALNEGFGVPTDETTDTDPKNAGKLNVEVWFNAMNFVDRWDGTADTTWYNDTDTEFAITTAEQLAGLAELVDGGNNFAGKTIKLGADVDLYVMGDNGEPVSFNPIGDKSAFAGTFDGQGHAIENMYQSGWAFGYEWGVYGSIGLFGELESATIKNLTISGAEAQIEGGDIGGITGSATGTCVFENIIIEDSNFGTYNNGIGGIIGWSGAGNYTFKNITLAEDTVLGGLWGSFDSSIGGVVGQGEPGATYNFENVDIACRIDAYNDCTASYDYYNYRMCGMIIGRLAETTTIDGVNYPDTSKYNIICNDVTVTYGEWANYHYCEPTPGLNGGRGMRVEPGFAYGGLPADFDHTQCVDNHMNLIPFDQIFGGDQLGVKGLKEYTGVTVIYNNK
ncbi:MAG: hypothetical protein E7654_04700 [Ruminococcaceae bacterium]|nr:hypothetical protein [Oscillospiraceae bacterium]